MVVLSKLYSLLKYLGQVRAWRVRIWTQKRLLYLQERFGWYSYSRWRRWCLEAQRLHLKERRNREPNQALIFSIFLYASTGMTDKHLLSKMVQSLQNGNWLFWKVHHLTPTHRQTEFQGTGKPTPENEMIGVSDDVCHHVYKPKDWSEMLQSVEGDWVGFWGQDDAIEPDLLSFVAECIDGTTDVVYFDEDCFTADASPVYHSPFFKPDWSPELLISVNYLRHALFRRQILLNGLTRVRRDDEIGLDDIIFLGCEKARKIVHLPGPLYHNRAESPDRSGESISRATLPACTKAIVAHLEREGTQDPDVVTTDRGEVHASWGTQEKLVSIIIPTKDKVEYLEKCIQSIQGVNHYANYEVVVVDSGSREEVTHRYYEDLRKDPKIQIIEYQGEFNYSRANNLGAKHAQGDLLLFLNNDVEAIEPDWLNEMVQWSERPQIGVVGAKLLYPDGLIQHAGIVLGMEGHGSHVFSGMGEKSSGPFGSVEWYRNYLAVTGACMLMRKEVFVSIGGFDETYELVFGDVEICVRAVEQGYRVVYNPFARLIHHEGKTRGRQMISSDIQKAFARFKDQVAAGDRYYNRYLTHAVRMPALRRDWEDNPLQRLERIVRDF